jgi:hypothetical protein
MGINGVVRLGRVAVMVLAVEEGLTTFTSIRRTR